MINTEILQAEQSMLLEMAILDEAIEQHKADMDAEYSEQQRQESQEAMNEYNSEPHN